MNKRKLKKLFKNPKKFFEDSRLVKKVKKAKSVSNYDKKNASLIVGKDTTREDRPLNIIGNKALYPRDFNFDSFVNRFYNIVPCFTIKKDTGRSSLCILTYDIYKFLEELAILSVKDNLIISYNYKNRLTRPSSYSELIEHLENEKLVEFKISDRRSKISIYFLLEVWNSIDNYFLAPRANIYSRRVFKSVLDQLYASNRGGVPDLSQIFPYPNEDMVDFDIDYVYTWVNSEDSDWQEMYSEYKPGYTSDGNSLSRFTNREELKYSLRSLEAYAPWIRTIFIVSNCKPPEWLNLNNGKIKWIYHEEIFDEKELPTFSSHAIESKLHKIPNLSTHFIYSNDDFFLARPTTKGDFFLSNGIAKLRFEAWGNVNGEISESDPDYLNAARNCQKLLENDFQKSTTQLHTHSPQSMNKEVLKQMASKYQKEFEITGRNRFRSITDIAVTGYLYHHYAYLTGKAIKDYTRTLLIQQNHNYANIYKKLLIEKRKVNGNLPLSFCVNDGANSHLNEKWNFESTTFLKQYFPYKSSFEN